MMDERIYLHATADLFTFSTATHGDWLGSHLLDSALDKKIS